MGKRFDPEELETQEVASCFDAGLVCAEHSREVADPALEDAAYLLRTRIAMAFLQSIGEEDCHRKILVEGLSSLRQDSICPDSVRHRRIRVEVPQKAFAVEHRVVISSVLSSSEMVSSQVPYLAQLYGRQNYLGWDPGDSAAAAA